MHAQVDHGVGLLLLPDRRRCLEAVADHPRGISAPRSTSAPTARVARTARIATPVRLRSMGTRPPCLRSSASPPAREPGCASARRHALRWIPNIQEWPLILTAIPETRKARCQGGFIHSEKRPLPPQNRTIRQLPLRSFWRGGFSPPPQNRTIRQLPLRSFWRGVFRPPPQNRTIRQLPLRSFWRGFLPPCRIGRFVNFRFVRSATDSSSLSRGRTGSGSPEAAHGRPGSPPAVICSQIAKEPACRCAAP